MPGLTPSSPPNASGTVRGLVSTVAQTFAGAKTFLARIVATLGITAGANRLDLRSDLGAGASDVCSVVGSTVADASVNAAAALLEGRTGLGSTEVTKFRVRKAGSFVAAVDNPNAIAFGLSTDLANVFPGFWYNPVTADLGIFNLNGAGALVLNIGTGNSRASGAFTAAAFGLPAPPLNAATGTPTATVSQTADKGRITVPAGATSVVVTNPVIGTNAFVGLEWEALPGVTHSVSYAAGSFTVTFSAALGSSLTFRYFVVR